ncbi:MAG: KH domain-containing protein [Clostridia bacterium]|nr:KH domain-containing protein [Clostridia bacterium]
MKRTATGIGSTIEEAYNDAKKKLDAPADAIIVQDSVKAPQKKVFGIFGGAKAEVVLSFEIPDAPAEKEKTPAAKTPELNNAGPAVKPENKKTAEKTAPAAKESKPKAEKKAEPQQKKAPAETKEEKRATAQAAAPAAVEDLPLIPVDKDPVYAYIKNILDGMGLTECTVTPHSQGDEYIFDIAGIDDYGIIIGRHGDTLDAIQYLARLVDARSGVGVNRRVTVNVAAYRERRREALVAQAKRNAATVRKYGRNVVLDPMNAYERRIIHTTVQEIEGVSSHSVGSDADRRVVITLEEGYTATNAGGGYGGGYGGRNGGRGRRDYGGDRRGGRNGGRGGRSAYVPDKDAEAVTRAPIQDADVPRYGKIEIPED